MFSAEELHFTGSQRVAHLATADANGRPQVVPVCFAHLDGRIYIAIDEKPKRTLRLRRMRNIDENPQVAIVLDRYDEDWSRLAWVLVQGTATVLDTGPEHSRALIALREKYPQYRVMALEDRPVISVTVERVSSWGELP
jgi:PPOX class probable F420-dependent enzyme